MRDFYKTIKEGISLGKIKQVQWDVSGDDAMFSPERVSVRITDVNDKTFDMVIHGSSEGYDPEEETILNTIFLTHGILTDGLYIGFNIDLSKAVNLVRQHFKGEFQSNEERCEDNEFITPRYIF